MSELNRVVCKMQCHSHTGNAQAPDEQGNNARSAQIRLGAVWEGSTENQRKSENAIFGFWTPSGAVELGICNPAAAEFFKQGKKYYVTFTEAPD